MIWETLNCVTLMSRIQIHVEIRGFLSGKGRNFAE